MHKKVTAILWADDVNGACNPTAPKIEQSTYDSCLISQGKRDIDLRMKTKNSSREHHNC